MTFCVKCGGRIEDGTKFCGSCGFSSESDAQANKFMAIMAYWLFFIPLITGDYKKSPFVRYHTNQGIVFLIASWVVVLIALIPAMILAFIPGVGTVVLYVLIIGGTFINIVPRVIGTLNVLKGEMKPLPIIGKYKIFKL